MFNLGGSLRKKYWSDIVINLFYLWKYTAFQQEDLIYNLI